MLYHTFLAAETSLPPADPNWGMQAITWAGVIISLLVSIAALRRKPSVDVELSAITLTLAAFKETIVTINTRLETGHQTHGHLREQQGINSANISSIKETVEKIEDREQQRDTMLERKLTAMSVKIDETVRSVFTHASQPKKP